MSDYFDKWLTLTIGDLSMKSPKYKLTANELERVGNIRKLESDGFTKEQISKQMYSATEGMSTPERRKLVKKLYERGEC